MVKLKNIFNFVLSRYVYMLIKWFIRVIGKCIVMIVNKEIWINVVLIMK